MGAIMVAGGGVSVILSFFGYFVSVWRRACPLVFVIYLCFSLVCNNNNNIIFV